MLQIFKKDKGVALILTLLIIAIIVTLTLHFNTTMRSELYAAINFQDNVRLGSIAESGFNCGLALLYDDSVESSFDTMHELWAQTQTISSDSESLFDEGRFELDIKDLSGKIRINRLIRADSSYDPRQKAILIRLLGLIDSEIDADTAEDIADAIKDWIDTDNEVTRFGAEDSYYQDLEPAYSCRNGPFESIEELLLVKGITPALLYGTEENPGIAPYITVYDDGHGRININTADSIVLQALSEGMDKEFVDEIVAYREEEDNDLSNPLWYKTALGTNEDILDPSLITTKGSLFEINSKGIEDNMIKEIQGVVRRENKDLIVLSWKLP